MRRLRWKRWSRWSTGIFRMDDRTHRAALRIEGRSAAPGIALGPLVRLAPVEHDVRQYRSAAEERQALARCARGVAGGSRRTLRIERATMKRKPFSPSRSRCSKTTAWSAPALARIDRRGEAANQAWSAAIDPEIASYDAADDPYFRARASDLRDLRDRVLRHLAGEADQIVPAGVIVAADDMPPSIFLATDWRDGGLVLRRGSPSSHVAILAQVARRADDRRSRRRSSRRWQRTLCSMRMRGF